MHTDLKRLENFRERKLEIAQRIFFLMSEIIEREFEFSLLKLEFQAISNAFDDW